MSEFSEYGDLAGWGLSVIEESINLVNEMGGRGVELVAGREGEYRHWDPETLKVDKDCEELFLKRLREKGLNATVLSEEAGKLEIAGEGEKVYFASDPFDGSLLYKRQIPAFWFTSLALFRRNGDALCAVVGDCAARQVDFCNEEKAYTGILAGGKLANVKELKPNETTDLSAAFVESYLMKPHYMYPAIKDYEPLFSKVKFILPNGGPSGFADVASGRVDVYFAHKQPYIDVWSGLPVAQKADCVTTTFEGEPLEFGEDIDARYNVICSCTQELHDQVLAIVKDCKSSE